MEIINEIANTICAGNAKRIKDQIQEALKRDIQPEKILDAIYSGLQSALKQYKDGKMFTPELMMCEKATEAGIGILQQYYSPIGIAIIGTLSCDRVYYYKNKGIIPAIMRASSFNVIDLGECLTGEIISEYLSENFPEIFIVISGGVSYKNNESCLIKEIRAVCGDFITIVVCQEGNLDGPKEAGVDCYCSDRANIPEIAKELMAKKLRKIQESNKFELLSTNGQLIKYINNPSKELQLKAIEQNAYAIRYIETPDEDVQIAAVEHNIDAFKHIKEPTDNVKMIVHDIEYIKRENENINRVKNNWRELEFIEQPSNRVIREAISQNGLAIQYVDYPSRELRMIAVKSNGSSIQHLNNPSQHEIIEALKQNGNAIQYIQNQTEDIQLIAVQNCGEAIKFIKSPTSKVRLTAINQNPRSIRFIVNPTEEEILGAVRKDGNILKYISKPTIEAQIAAISNKPLSIKYIEKPSEEIQLNAITIDAHAIAFIKSPTLKVQLMAVKQNGEMIKYIKKPSKKVKDASITQSPNAQKYLTSYLEDNNFCSRILEEPFLVVYSPSWSLPGANLNQIEVEKFKSKAYALKRLRDILCESLDTEMFDDWGISKIEKHIAKIDSLIDKINESGTDKGITLKSAEIEVDSFSLKILYSGYWPKVAPDILKFTIEKLKEYEEWDEDTEFDVDEFNSNILAKALELLKRKDYSSIEYIDDFEALPLLRAFMLGKMTLTAM